MVCVPCIVIPFFLFIWYRFIQPVVLKFWNPWAKVESTSPPVNAKVESTSPPVNAKVESTSPPVNVTDGSCPQQSLSSTASSVKVDSSNEESTEQEEGKKEL